MTKFSKIKKPKGISENVAAHQKRRVEIFRRQVFQKGIDTISKKIEDQLGNLTGQIPIPSDLDVGIATRFNVKSFRECNWFKLKAGIFCGRCFCSSFKLKLDMKNRRVICDYCSKKMFRRHVNPKKVMLQVKEQTPPCTTERINYIALIGRSSGGHPINSSKFENLKNFANSWKEFPNKNNHKFCFFENFGAFGSGLASYETMNRHVPCDEVSNMILKPISDIVDRLTGLHRPNIDSVTLVFYQIAGLSTKLSNIIKLIHDFKSNQIQPDFVFYGMDQCEGVTRFEPFTVSSNEFLELQRKERDTPLISQMKLECFARIFRFISGRNNGVKWIDVEKIDMKKLQDIIAQIEFE